MTPEEKAEGLLWRYLPLLESWKYDNSNYAKQCALIAVDEIINTLNCDIRDLDVRGSVLLDLIQYWQEVKQELLKIK